MNNGKEICGNILSLYIILFYRIMSLLMWMIFKYVKDGLTAEHSRMNGIPCKFWTKKTDWKMLQKQDAYI